MAEPRRHTRTMVAAVAVGAVAVGGVVLPWVVPDRSTADQPAAVAQPATVRPRPSTAVSIDDRPAGQAQGDVEVAAPSSATWGVPVGYPQSPAGVRAASVAWVATLGDLLQMGPIARDDTLRELLSQRAFGDTVEEFRSERDRFSAQFGRDVSQAVWVDAPLSVTITSAEATRAVVEVWSVLLFGTAGERVEMLWRTHTVTLLWEGGSWRVDEVSRRDGPTPVLATTAMPSTGSEFGDVMAWAPAVLAGTSVG